MRKFILITSVIGLLLPGGLTAQKVYKEYDDKEGYWKFILDLTEEAGMPADAITSESKTEAYKNFDPSNSQLGSIGSQSNTPNNPINEKVYQKLEIAPYGMDRNGIIPGSSSGDNRSMDWATAVNKCRDAQYKGDGWRLPTQRELMLIMIFRDAFDRLDIPEPFNAGTSITEDSASNVYKGSSEGGVNNSNKGTLGLLRLCIARCVREVTD